MIGRATVPPGVPDPDPMDSVTLCPKVMVSKPSSTKIVNRFRCKFAYLRGELVSVLRYRRYLDFPLESCVLLPRPINAWSDRTSHFDFDWDSARHW